MDGFNSPVITVVTHAMAHAKSRASRHGMVIVCRLIPGAGTSPVVIIARSWPGVPIGCCVSQSCKPYVYIVNVSPID
jgi:hypothetical protein